MNTEFSHGSLTLRDVSRDHPEAKHCHALCEVRDESVGLHAFIAIHDVSRGPGFGGVRRRVFSGGVREAVSEVVRLAEQMTLKTAFAGLEAGGAKAVILERPHVARGPLYERLAKAIEQLDGAFVAGSDVGTGDAEMALLRQGTRYALKAEGNLFESSARGVVASCDEAFRFLGLEPRVSLDSAVIVGVGSVGSLVARGLASRGFKLAVCDIDHHRASLHAAALGASVVEPSEVLPRAQLLLSPCAVSPVVTAATLPRIKARVICGSANQQLEADQFAVELAARDVLYVPDFAANAGAVIEGVIRYFTRDGEDPSARVEVALEAIGPRVKGVLELARSEELTPLEAALMQLDQAPDLP
jgi:glutamate dehydrogenase/leucine dehydrogenase